MKNLVIASAFILTTVSFAQEKHQKRGEHKKENIEFIKNLSPEQQASLKTKRMTLALDLTKSQQQEIYTINLEKAKKRKNMHLKKERNSILQKKELSSEERFDIMSTRLDEKIAHKKRMKSILSEKQFEQWQKMHKKRITRKHKK